MGGKPRSPSRSIPTPRAIPPRWGDTQHKRRRSMCCGRRDSMSENMSVRERREQKVKGRVKLKWYFTMSNPTFTLWARFGPYESQEEAGTVREECQTEAQNLDDPHVRHFSAPYCLAEIG